MCELAGMSAARIFSTAAYSSSDSEALESGSVSRLRFERGCESGGSVLISASSGAASASVAASAPFCFALDLPFGFDFEAFLSIFGLRGLRDFLAEAGNTTPSSCRFRAAIASSPSASALAALRLDWTGAGTKTCSV